MRVHCLGKRVQNHVDKHQYQRQPEKSVDERGDEYTTQSGQECDGKVTLHPHSADALTLRYPNTGVRDCR
jgi:hypothetical protein